MYRHEEAGGGDRTLTIRPQSDRDDRNREVDQWRYDQYREYDYRPSPYSPSRDDDYQIIHRSEVMGDRRLTRRERDYDDYYDERSTYRREISPHSSASHYRERRYTSDDDLVYVNRPSRDRREESPHHKRHIAEGALVGIGAAEAIQYYQKKHGEPHSDALTRFGKDLGGGALGAVAGGMLSRARSLHRSKSRRRAESLDRRSHKHHHHHHRHRSRSSSRSRTKTLASLGLGAAAVTALAVGLARKKSQRESERESPSRRSSRSRRSRSQRRRSSSTSSDSDRARTGARSASRRNKKIAEAGLAGAVAAGLLQKARSKSRSRKGDRSRSRIRKSVPVVAAALGTAAIAAIHEKNKANKDDEKAGRRQRRRSRSRSRPRSRSRSKPRSTQYPPDLSRNEHQLIQYGDDPVLSGLDEYYGSTASQERYSPQTIEANYDRRKSRERRGYRDPSNSGSSSSASERQSKSRRRQRKKSRSRSRPREFATAPAAAGPAGTGAGPAAREYADRDRRRGEKERQRYEDDPFEEQYSPTQMPSPPPPSGPQFPQGPYYPQSNSFPPPPRAAPGNPPAQYNPGDYPPPPGALPQTQPFQYPSPPAPAPDPYAPRTYRGDENVSAAPPPNPFAEQRHMSSDGLGTTQRRSRSPGSDPLSELATSSAPKSSRPRSASQPAVQSSKTVQFDLGSDRSSPQRDRGYESDDSDSSIESHDNPRDQQNRRHLHSTPWSRRPPRKHPSPPGRSRPEQGLTGSSSKIRRSDNERIHDQSETDSSESGSTIDLPDRFNSEGDPVPGPDPLVTFLKASGDFLLHEQDRVRRRT